MTPDIKIVESKPRFSNMIKALSGRQVMQAENRAINRAGDMARTAMVPKLRQQTGLKAKTVRSALRVTRSSWQTLAYTITVRGGDIKLKHFAARETLKGVSANPFGQRKRFAGSFIMGGKFPNRKPLNLGGQVFKRIGKKRKPVETVRSGVVLPEEVVKGETIAAFQTVGAAKLEERMTHELNRLLQEAR